jgi:glutathione S-transferase
MELVTLITVLALTQYLFFVFNTGMARKKYGIQAPAISGHPLFERHYRVQTNTLEQLVVFVPALWVFATMVERTNLPGNETAAVLGVIWLVGRTLYARAYVANPSSRGVGFLLTLLPTMLLLLGTFVAILVAIAG